MTSRRLGAVAAQLLGEKRVRLYQDCVFLKEPGFTPTNWHSDLPLSPLDTNSFLTAWIPLRPLKVRFQGVLLMKCTSRCECMLHGPPLVRVLRGALMLSCTGFIP